MVRRLEYSMSKTPYCADPTMSLREAADMMKECDFRHLPVVEEDELAGFLSDRDLKEAMALPLGHQLLVRDIMKTQVYCVNRDTPVRDVVADMAQLKIGAAVIIDDDRSVLGIFTTTDALRMLADILDDEAEEEFVPVTDYYESWLPLEERLA